jgi:Sulfotransferase family
LTGLLQRTVGRLRGTRWATDLPYPQPVVIFGTGGSGTRVLQVLTDHSGYYLGTNLNRAGDALDIGHFMRRWLDRYLGRTDWIGSELRGSEEREYGYPLAMAEDFALTLEQHRDALDDPQAMWGWKAPRTILILPFVHELFGGMRAIHLVRDGRDMAYSRNQQQMRRHAPQLLEAEHDEAGEPVRSIAFWARVNLAAARYGERELGSNYLRIRYEDICSDPSSAVVELLDFIDSPASRESMQRVAAEKIHPSSSIGRWREHDQAELDALHDIAGAALRKFGYE